jgi:integrase
MAARRRAKGEGSIVHRSDGLWQYSIDLGKNPEGKRQRTYIYAPTRADLVRKVADERARSGGSIRRRGRDTISEWTERWLTHEKRPNLAPSTYAVYEVAWRVHANPLIGNLRLDRFEASDVARAYDELRKKKVGGRTIQVVAKVMRGAFDAAVRQEKYHRPNPWRSAPIPRHDYKEPHVLTEEESARFLTAVEADRFEALWLLSLFGGLRLGESLGLRWDDIDLRTGVIEVRKQITEVNGESAESALKTKSSRRKIIVGKIVVAALKRRMRVARDEGHESEFVFTDTEGKFLNRTYLRRRHFNKVCKAAELDGVHPHDLRHTMASHAIAAGLSPIVVAGRLGHGSTRMTLDRYGHQLPGAQAVASRVLEKRLTRALRSRGRPK